MQVKKIAIAYDKCNLSLKSAESFVNAAITCKYLEQWDELIRLLQEAKIRYLEGNHAHTAIMTLTQMAKSLESINPQIAYKIYDMGLTLAEEVNDYAWVKDSFVDFALLALSMNKFPAVFNCWKRAENAFLECKNMDEASHCIVSAIVIHLKRGDIVAAEKEFNDAMQCDFFIRTEDFSMIDMILRGVKNNDTDLIKRGQKNIIIQFLRPAIAKIIYSFNDLNE